jgi:hypothetical protein
MAPLSWRTLELVDTEEPGYSMAMMNRCAFQAALMGLLLMTGCAKQAGDAKPPPSSENQPPAPVSERPALTTAECEAKNGQIVGDIGDGAIHRPDYTCANGQPPLGSITPAEGGPVATEGSVCCPAA